MPPLCWCIGFLRVAKDLEFVQRIENLWPGQCRKSEAECTEAGLGHTGSEVGQCTRAGPGSTEAGPAAGPETSSLGQSGTGELRLQPTVGRPERREV